MIIQKNTDLTHYRFFFYSNENGEPAHIHIQRDRMLAKFWLRPIALAGSTRFSPKELRKLESLIGVLSDKTYLRVKGILDQFSSFV